MSKQDPLAIRQSREGLEAENKQLRVTGIRCPKCGRLEFEFERCGKLAQGEE